MIEPKEKAKQLRSKYGKLALHVAKDILDEGSVGITRSQELIAFLRYWKSVINEI
jgi:hypothetical protein